MRMEDMGEEQREVIDAAFTKLKSDRQLRSERQSKEPAAMLFSMNDLENIRKDFQKICK